MKTLIACLMVIAAALWLGLQQRERIRELRKSENKAHPTSTAMSGPEGNPNLRTKSHTRPTQDQVTVDELFDEIMRIHNAPEKPPAQYSFRISEIASENSELLRKMSLLDAASLEQLIERIHASP
ncbi:MAG: hypothetical protein MUF86_01555, partial [Akkermansiaceae bacterium]|nr:hypothetical protein [Akkermansiaceae bacterium]